MCKEHFVWGSISVCFKFEKIVFFNKILEKNSTVFINVELWIYVSPTNLKIGPGPQRWSQFTLIINFLIYFSANNNFLLFTFVQITAVIVQRVVVVLKCWQTRIQSYMGRVKEIQDKQLAPRLNVDASKRFVRNALWDAAQKSSTPTAVKSMSVISVICK